MKKRYLLPLGVLLFPFIASAASVHFGDYFLKGAEISKDDVYVLGRTATFAGKAEGDIVSISRTIFSQSEILGDAFFIGGEVRVEGSVADDVRSVGGLITIDGTVKDDVVAVGSRIVISSTAKIEGSLFAIGSIVDIRGEVQGDVKALAESVLLSGSVEGDMEVWGAASFREPARITGDFIYHTNGASTVPVNVVITGKTILDAAGGKGRGLPVKSLLGGFFSLNILMMLTLGFTLFFLTRERTEDVLLETMPNFGMRVLRGALILVLLPAVIVLLLPTVIGIPLALMFGALLLLLVVLSWVFAGILLGAWCERLFFRRSPFPLTYRPVLLGIIFLAITSLIPLVGPVFHGILLLAVAGSIGTLFFRHMRRKIY